jgi:hypothetical protein
MSSRTPGWIPLYYTTPRHTPVDGYYQYYFVVIIIKFILACKQVTIFKPL